MKAFVALVGYFCAMEAILLESQYSGSVLWWACIAQSNAVSIDLGEYFVKGSLRNRCYILSPNGSLRLSVPLERGKHQRRPMKDVRISYDSNWQKIHWMSIVSSYRRSAFFEYYEDDIAPLFRESPSLLHELNNNILLVVSALLKLDITVSYLEKYMPPGSFEGIDIKDNGSTENAISIPAYMQVFADRYDFLPNLSIWDVLFNLGPAGKEYLLNIDLNPIRQLCNEPLL